MKNANRTMRLYIFSSLFFDFFRYKSKIVVLIVRNFSVYVYFFFFYITGLIIQIFQSVFSFFSMNIILKILIDLENIIRII